MCPRSCHPFQILHGDFEFVEPYFDGVSSQAKDLIRKMLVVDPEKRLSAKVHSYPLQPADCYHRLKG